jgi:PKD repeat protein
VDTQSDINNLNFTWQLDDSSEPWYKYGQVLELQFFKAGQYKMKLMVTDDNGETEWITKKIKVLNVDPTAKILVSGTKYITDSPVTFSAVESYDSDSDLEYLNFSWEFGDESTVWGSVVTHMFSDPGKYQVTLSVTDDDGAIGTEEISIEIEEGGQPEITDAESKTGQDHSWVLPMIIFNVALIAVLVCILFFYLKRTKGSSGENDS